MKEVKIEDIYNRINELNFIDIRENYLYNLGTIPNSKNIPLNFLLMNPDEIKYTAEGEMGFIKDMNESDGKMLVLAFVDGEYAGNCSFTRIGTSRRSAHRADIGIALLQKYTGFGLGRLMLEQLLKKIKEAGYQQAELTVVSGNERAYHLYESLGFKECGRMPKANKYDDGSYSDNIHMVLQF